MLGGTTEKEVDGMRRKKKRASKRLIRNRIILTGMCFGVLVALYIGGAIYFRNHFFPNTYIDELKVSNKSISKVEKSILAKADEYYIKLIERGNRSEYITAMDVELTWSLDGQVEELKKKQGCFGWLFSIFEKEEYHVVPTFSYSKENLESSFQKLDCLKAENNAAPEDAYIEIANGSYHVVPEVIGSTVKKKKLYRKIQEAIENNFMELDLEEAGCYEEPAITTQSASIQEPMKELERYRNAEVEYIIEGSEEKVTPELFYDWLEIEEDYSVSINRTKAMDYVISMARRYDTWSLSRQFVTSEGKEITVSGGSYGWLVARNSECEQLLQDLESGKKVKREPIYSYKAWARVPNDIGDTYIEISLKEQHMWLYKDGELIVDTDVVTGKPTKERNTPKGVYPINYKTRNGTLVGEDYESKVDYWIPFNHNIGIHDASWRRGAFGGDIYKTRGSHGCINTPLDKVSIIYEYAVSGMPVIVY